MTQREPPQTNGKKADSTQGMGIEPTAFLLQICVVVAKYGYLAALDFSGALSTIFNHMPCICTQIHVCVCTYIYFYQSTFQ